jgi:proline dehydrogenase
MIMPNEISFNDTAKAFEYKTDKELKKAHFLFKLMGNNFFVQLGTRLTPWAIRIGLPVKNLIRKTIFRQFVGGETLEQTAIVADKLEAYHVQVILDYGVEGGDYDDASLDHAGEEFIKVINYAATQANIPFISIKITGIARTGLLEKLDQIMHATDAPGLIKKYTLAVQQLTAAENSEWQKVVLRLDKICETASSKKIGVLVDAEETWIQDPVDALTMQMMDHYNKNTALVYNTLQMYRHDRLQFLKDAYQAGLERGFIVAVKLVRGAYMEKERNRAQAKGYPSPIQPDKNTCDRDYDAAILFCITFIQQIAVIVASHNENSNLLTTKIMEQQGLSLKHPHLHFSQLYGMSDNITFNLAAAGCSVSKYLPFGPIKDVVPYLMRRAQENSSVSGHTGRELGLIRKELRRRRS